MIDTISEYQFTDWFMKHRPDNFSYKGTKALFDYLEDLGISIIYFKNKVNIKTTGDLPIPKGSTSYFNRGKQTFKAITPITTIGANIQAQEDMEAYQAEQARLMKQEYFQDAGMSLLASGSANPNISFIDFTNPNPSPTELFNLQNSYSGILS